jgi:hypothetical protein
MIGQSIGLGFSESVHGLVKHVIKINVEAVFKTFSLHVLSAVSEEFDFFIWFSGSERFHDFGTNEI